MSNGTVLCGTRIRPKVCIMIKEVANGITFALQKERFRAVTLPASHKAMEDKPGSSSCHGAAFGEDGSNCLSQVCGSAHCLGF